MMSAIYNAVIKFPIYFTLDIPIVEKIIDIIPYIFI